MSFNQNIIDEFRANDGVVGGQFENSKLLLLTTTGAKSGLQRVNPLAYVADGDQLIVFASFAGAPMNPPWFYNLLANPEVGVERGAEQFMATASVIEEPDRSRLYNEMIKLMPAFAKYRETTTRTIPVIRLTRI